MVRHKDVEGRTADGLEQTPVAERWDKGAAVTTEHVDEVEGTTGARGDALFADEMDLIDSEPVDGRANQLAVDSEQDFS